MEYTDMLGYVVTVGTIVGFNENYEESEMYVNDGKVNLSYIVTGMSVSGDLGLMVEMHEAYQIYPNAPKESHLTDIWEVVPESHTISVQSHKIGAI